MSPKVSQGAVGPDATPLVAAVAPDALRARPLRLRLGPDDDGGLVGRLLHRRVRQGRVDRQEYVSRMLDGPLLRSRIINFLDEFKHIHIQIEKIIGLSACYVWK